MKNIRMNFKGLVGTLVLSLVALVATPCAEAGDIYSIFPVDESFEEITTKPVASVDEPLVAGDVVRFGITMISSDPDRAFRPHWLGTESEAVGMVLSPFRLGIYVSGEVRYAKLVEYMQEGNITTFYFEYEVRPGDLALPVVLACGQDNPHPADPSAYEDREYHVLPLSLTKWAIDDSTEWGDAATATAVLSFMDAASVPEPDFDLRGAGFYVKTVGFDENETDDVWRTIPVGAKATGYIHVDAMPTNTATLYVWSMDESVVSVDGEPSEIHFSSFSNATRNVATIKIKAGVQDYPITIASVNGDAALDQETQIVLSGSKDFSYFVGTGERYDDYLTATVRVRVPKTCPIVYENLKGATHSNPTSYVEGDEITFAAPGEIENWTFAGWSPSAITADMTGTLTVTANWTFASLSAPTITPTNGSFFVEDFCEVTLSNAVEAAKIYFTTNGTSPRTTDKFLYTKPFTIDQTTTVKAIAVYEGVKSDLATAVVTKKILTLAEGLGLGEAQGVTVVTDGAAEWRTIRDASAASGISVRSGQIGDATDGDWVESRLEVSVDGPGTFTFKWRVDCERDDYGDVSWDHLAVFVEDEEKARIDGTTEWATLSFTFETEGTHAIRWVFAKDTEPNESFTGEDCAWVADCVWKAKGADEVTITPAAGGASFVIPASWFAQYPTLGGTTVAEWQSIAEGAGMKATPVWQDYVAGTDPTNAASKFTAKIEMKDGSPVVTWSPALNGEGVREGTRIYRVWGKANLDDAAWSKVSDSNESAYRFFRVTVEMP